MRRLTRLGIFAIALTFCFGAISVMDSNAQGPVNAILKRMQDHKEALQSLKADVAMEKYDSMLKIPDTISGTTYYLPGKGRDPFVRVNWTKPLDETLVVKNGEYILYRPRLNQAIVGKVSEANKDTKTNSAFDFMNMSKRELTSNYEVQMLDNVKISGDEVWHLKLTPKGRKNYKYAELWVNKDGMPVRMKLVENNNDYTKVDLTNINKNLKDFNANIFNFKIPRGTKIL